MANTIGSEAQSGRTQLTTSTPSTHEHQDSAHQSSANTGTNAPHDMRAQLLPEWQSFYRHANQHVQQSKWLVTTQISPSFNEFVNNPPAGMTVELDRCKGAGDKFMVHFDAGEDQTVKDKLQNADINLYTVSQSVRDNGFVAMIDDYFSPDEIDALEKKVGDTKFTTDIYTSFATMQRGEKPVSSLGSRESFELLKNPTPELQHYFNALSHLAAKIDAKVHLQPFDACSVFRGANNEIQNNCVISFAQNKLNEMSHESSQEGYHQDYDPQTGTLFHLPDVNGGLTNRFENGAPGMPWMVTTMLYVAGDDFDEDHGMGTVILDKVIDQSANSTQEANASDNSDVTYYDRSDNTHYVGRTVNSKSGRILMFEGDLRHNIGPRYAPKAIQSQRTSLVFKVVFTPNPDNQSNLRDAFREALRAL